MPESALTCRSLNEDRDAEKAQIQIDGIPMTAKADWTFSCTFGKARQTKTVEVVLEVYPRSASSRLESLRRNSVQEKEPHASAVKDPRPRVR